MVNKPVLPPTASTVTFSEDSKTHLQLFLTMLYHLTHCLILCEFLTDYNDWNSLKRNYVFFYSRHGKQIQQCQRELEAVL